MLHTLLSGRDLLLLPILHLPKLPLTLRDSGSLLFLPLRLRGSDLPVSPTGLWSHQYPGPNTSVTFITLGPAHSRN